jgi:hypothetical protein
VRSALRESLVEVLARHDAFMQGFSRMLARGEEDLQEDLLQDARLALCMQFTKGLRSPTHARVVAASAMLHGRRAEMRRRHESIEVLIEREAFAARADEREAA